MREYFQFGKFKQKAIWNHFGTWNNLLNKLNIKTSRTVEHLTKEDIFILIEKLWIDFGRQPNMRDFEAKTRHTKKIIISRFGKWSICLKEFVAWENKRKQITNQNITEELKHKTPREPSKSLRYDVMKRDHFKCVLCGKSPANDPNIELHVDHIVPYSEGGETVLENLQTLCSECNLGKGNKI